MLYLWSHFISQFYIFHGLPLTVLNWNFYFGLFVLHILRTNLFSINSWLCAAENWYKEHWSQVSVPPRPSHVVTVFSQQQTWESLFLWRLCWHAFRPLDTGEFYRVFTRKKCILCSRKCNTVNIFCVVYPGMVVMCYYKIWICMCTAETKHI